MSANQRRALRVPSDYAIKATLAIEWPLPARYQNLQHRFTHYLR